VAASCCEEFKTYWSMGVGRGGRQAWRHLAGCGHLTEAGAAAAAAAAAVGMPSFAWADLHCLSAMYSRSLTHRKRPHLVINLSPCHVPNLGAGVWTRSLQLLRDVWQGN